MKLGAASRIDAHQHYWTLARGDYRWPTREEPALFRDFGPRDLEPELAAQGIAGTLLVQATDTLEESRWLLALAERASSVRGVVGWIDCASAHAHEDLVALARAPRLVGVRPMLQDLSDDRWVLQPCVLDVLRELPRHELVLDALVRPRHLTVVAELLERVPELDVVVDHAGKPRIGSASRRWSDFAAWRAHHARIAAHPRAHCKISGLVTEREPDADAGELARVVETVLELYGPARCLWGSDWPVLLVSTTYAAWLEQSHALLARLDEAERALVLGESALRFYRRARGSQSRAASVSAEGSPGGAGCPSLA